jgi:hypothetical protein
MKPRRIEIATSAAPQTISQDNQKQVEGAKAA